MRDKIVKKLCFIFLTSFGLVFFSTLIKAQEIEVESVFETIEVSRTLAPLNFQTNQIIEQYIAYYQGRGRQSIQAILFRSSRHEKMIRRIFSEEGVPEDLSWMQQLVVESGGTTGWNYIRPLWFFTPNIARKYGLQKTKYLDETKSFEKATRAMAQYLKFLYHKYNKNWEMALGAYKSGEGNVDYAIKRAKTKDYWKIYQYLPRETRNFVPNVLAAILIANNPQEYNFTEVKKDSSFEYELFRIPPSVSLERIAEYAGTDIKFIKQINPELISNLTPPKPYIIRVPMGSGQIFAQRMRSLLSK